MHLPTSLKKALQNQPIPAFAGDWEAIESCPKLGGIYLLLLQLDHPLTIARPSAIELPPALYGYIGSAYGPGGLRARLARHLRSEKKVRWHIDQISIKAEKKYAYGWQEGEECTLRAALERDCHVTHPLLGFGSSDCQSCPSHLVRIVA